MNNFNTHNVHSMNKYRSTNRPHLYNINKSLNKMKKVLIIEDDIDMAEGVSNNLKKYANCSVQIAQDPFEAMNLMMENYYDLIILDWQLPGMNGTETLAQTEAGLKLDPSLSAEWDHEKVPVVIFTSAKKSDCSIRRTKHFNYVGFVSKMQPMNTIINAFGDYINNSNLAKAT